MSLKNISKKFIVCISATLFFNTIFAQNQGDRAQKFRGTWWGGVHATLLDDDFLSLKTIDGWRVILTRGATQSALHFAPVPLLSGLDGADEVFPANNDTAIQDQLNKIENAGYMVQVYNNSENFIGGNQPQFEEFAESWKEWCDTNPQAQAFINSQSYHRKAGFPNRHYMFCYAEFVVKYYSQQYGRQIDLWTFDAGHVMVANGDSDTSGNVDDQRLYLAFADAARAGNNEIAVAFNNGRSNSNFPGYPFAHATRADDFTFGHAFGGNGNHAEKVNGNQFNLNYQHVSRMTETNGYVHDEGRETWDDNIVGHFSSKLSTAAWDFGSNPAWEQDDFNAWNEEALLAGGMMTWYGSNNRANSFVYDWVYPQLKALDDYLFERGISVNAENNGNPAVAPPVNEVSEVVSFTPDPNKTYYIDSPIHNLRLAASGNNEDPYTTSRETTGADVEWKFTSNGSGSWYIDRADGGTLPRIRTDRTSEADMQADSYDGSWESFVFYQGATNNTHFITSNGPDQFSRLQIDRAGNVNMTPSTTNGTWESFIFTEAETDSRNESSPSGTVVHITKRNAPGFALDGNRRNIEENGTNVYLWEANPNNVNQQWLEIDRGNGYYTYQKLGTDFVLDGGQGGETGQNVYLWEINENNRNQHWEKVDVGGGAFQLIKRNSDDFAINGGSNGVNEQNVNLFDASNVSRNLQWFITPIDGVSAKSLDVITSEKVIVYPNPVATTTTIQGAVNTTVRIYDFNGKIVFTKSILSNNEIIDLSRLSTGIYYTEIKGLFNTSVLKIIKK